MKFLTFTACLAAACVTAAAAGGASRPTFSPRTIVCQVPSVYVTLGTAQGGAIVVEGGGYTLLNATPRFGTIIDAPRCKRIRTRAVPKPIVPRPNYPMGLGASSDCTTSAAVVIHAHFLRSAGRVTGLYVSVRIRRTGRFVVAGLLTARGRSREYIGPTCVAR